MLPAKPQPEMTHSKFIFVGNVVNPMCIHIGAYLTVENGKITQIGNQTAYEELKKSRSFCDYEVIELTEDQFLMPGFVDCHTHAPQFPNLGLGLDKPLLEWLDSYTFPLEKKYSDVDFASRVYDKVVKRLLNNGITTACYFGSIHIDGTLELVNSAIKHHQRALVGKVSMNVENNHDYYNETKKELVDVENFVKKVLELKNDLVQPVVTPRFAVSCDQELMTGLAEIAKKYDCRIQSHISENLKEIEYVLEKFPECSSYSDVYDKCNILTEKEFDCIALSMSTIVSAYFFSMNANRDQEAETIVEQHCIMAHAVHLSEDEMKLLAAKGVSVAHCPASNTRLFSGACPVSKLIRHGITVGLGTDVSGGDNANILDAIRRALDVAMFVDEGKITSDYALYMATLGGAKALNLDDKIGSLEVGKDFDALVIDVYPQDGPISHFPEFPALDPRNKDFVTNLVQRFLYAGDDRNIVQVYVKGEKVKDIMK